MRRRGKSNPHRETKHRSISSPVKKGRNWSGGSSRASLPEEKHPETNSTLYPLVPLNPCSDQERKRWKTQPSHGAEKKERKAEVHERDDGLLFGLVGEEKNQRVRRAQRNKKRPLITLNGKRRQKELSAEQEAGTSRGAISVQALGAVKSQKKTSGEPRV